jgi:uncharacterized membrane protein YagU involved in acid resistance
MNPDSSSFATFSQELIRPIAIGDAIAGTLDQIAACISLGWNVPRIDAAGLLGPYVIEGQDASIWALGLTLHFFIAFCAAAVYCISSYRLDLLRGRFLISGIFFGIAVFLVMYLVVMPLCAFHYKGPYTFTSLAFGTRPVNFLFKSQNSRT